MSEKVTALKQAIDSFLPSCYIVQAVSSDESLVVWNINETIYEK